MHPTTEISVRPLPNPPAGVTFFPIVKGLQKTTLIDFPGKLACILFVGGCNMRCHYCYNAPLVLRPASLTTIPPEQIFEFLESRKNYLEGVCISGGEPTLYGKRLMNLCSTIKNMGYFIKLDTNGTHPSVIKELIEKKLVDYIAMDIKASLENYESITDVTVPIVNIKRSIFMIMHSGINYEFRTTVVPGHFDEQEAHRIGQLIQGAQQYYLQNFHAGRGLINPSYEKYASFSLQELTQFKKIIEQYVGFVVVRG